MEFTDGGVRSKNRWKLACLGATPAWFRIMYSRMKARRRLVLTAWNPQFDLPTLAGEGG